MYCYLLQALDSAYGAGTRAHLLAAVATTMETIAFSSIAKNLPRDYPASLGDALLSWCSAMLVYTWVVLVLEMAIPFGRDPPGLLPPPSPRLALGGTTAPGIPPINVQMSRTNILPPDDSSSDNSSNHVLRGWGGGKSVVSVVPTEE